ncbi:MAG: hypothetical protein F6J93_13135 [Oscillatoria sp. SIO1A7]|nr:hypothetical protein [Oscillatoria sp. SIO1A7]
MKPESRVPVGLSSSRKRSGNSMKFPYTRAPHTPHPRHCPYRLFQCVSSIRFVTFSNL